MYEFIIQATREGTNQYALPCKEEEKCRILTGLQNSECLFKCLFIEAFCLFLFLLLCFIKKAAHKSQSLWSPCEILFFYYNFNYFCKNVVIQYLIIAVYQHTKPLSPFYNSNALKWNQTIIVPFT